MHRRIVLFSAALIASACGGGDNISISGKLERSAATKGSAYAVEVAIADEIWALPIGGLKIDQFSFTSKEIVEVGSDGSFEFVPDQTSYDYVLALVNTSKCDTVASRADWTDSDIDARLECIVGVVSIPEALGSEALSAVPVTKQSCAVDLERVSGDTYQAKSQTDMESAANCLTGDIDELRTIARTDNTLLGIGNVYGNTDFDANQYYSMNLNYSWSADNSLMSAVGQLASATDLEFGGYQFYFQTNVDVATFSEDAINTPGYLSLTSPATVTSDDALITFGPNAPLVSSTSWDVDSNRYYEPNGFGFEVNSDNIFGGVAAAFSGVTADGEWRFERGSQIARANLALVAPFVVENGSPNPSKPATVIPVPNITLNGTTVESVSLEFVWTDGTSEEVVPYEVARGLVSSYGVGFNNADGSCNEQSSYNLTQDFNASSFSWTPNTTFTIGGAGECEVVTVFTFFEINGVTFGFSWDAPGF